MIHYRSFRNTDPPAITAIWRSRAGQNGMLQPVSVDLLEQLVFGKLYFDYPGMIIAWEGDRAVGFAHAGFGPNHSRDDISVETGITCMIVARPDGPEAEVLAGLLERSEAYLRQRGAKVLYGGCVRPLSPFYLGLYGGAEPAGVLQSDAPVQSLYRQRGYQEFQRRLIFRRQLADFRPRVDRRQLQFRRCMSLQITVDAPTRDWWEACTTGDFDLTRVELRVRGSETALGQVVFRSMDAMGPSGLVRCAGVLELYVQPEHRQQGIATFLLGEALAELNRDGYSMAEIHVPENNAPALGLLGKLGFRQADQGIVFRKEA